MMRTLIWAGVFAALAVAPALAGFDRWTYQTKDDPFAGGLSVIVDYTLTRRSGISMFCDQARRRVRIRAVPGYDYDPVLDRVAPEMSVIVDGGIVLDRLRGLTAPIGSNLAAAEFDLEEILARNFLAAFIGAQRQVAIKDGISDRPYLLSARGSTASGNALVRCLDGDRKPGLRRP